MRTTRILACLVAVAMLVGCGDKPPRRQFDAGFLPSDGSTDSGSGPTDGSTEDGGVDEPDADVEVDASTIDAGTVDAAMPDAGSGGGMMCLGVPTSCSGGCPSGMRCITSMCGASICAAAGADCESDADCHADSTCSGSVCVPSNGEVCNDARDCSPGHQCEGASGSRECVSRRIPCPVDENCPLGYVCRTPGSGEGAFCEYIHRPCDDGKVCPIAFSDGCLDVDGDGETECAPPMGQCNRSSQCSGSDACIYDAISGSGGTCAAAGLCDVGASACGSGLSCVALVGSGPGQCVGSGECSSNDDCGDHGVCAVLSGSSTPTCFDAL